VTTTAATSTKSWFLYLVVFVVGLHVISASWHIFYGGQNIDEGFYALAARAVWQGELPYRDFGYTQMPLLPYVNGLAMQVIGFGLFEQRAVNGLWAAITLLLMGLWLARHTRQAWAIGFVAFLSLSAPWMYYIHLGKTYAFTGLTALAALWVYTEWKPGVKKILVLAALGTIGSGCRLPATVYFAVLWFAAFVELPRQPARRWLLVGLESLVFPLILLLPFYVAAPEAAKFWTMDFHRIEIAHKLWHLSLSDVVVLAPALWLSLCAAAFLAVKFRNCPSRADSVVGIATLLTLAVNLMPNGVYEEYAVPFIPPHILVAITGNWRTGSTIGWLRHAVIPVGLLLFNLAATVAIIWPAMPAVRHDNLSLFLSLGAPDYDATLPGRIAQARKVVKEFLPANQPFIGPFLILAAETDRFVPHTLRMGPFTATADYSPAQALRLNLATWTELDAYFKNPSIPVVAFTKTSYLNYVWSMPSHRNLAEHDDNPWFDLFRKEFLVAYEDRDFFILVRKSAAGTSH